MKIALVVLAAVVAYAFMGGVAYGVSKRLGDQDGDAVAQGALWPIMAVLVAVYAVAVWPVRLGRYVVSARGAKLPKATARRAP